MLARHGRRDCRSRGQRKDPTRPTAAARPRRGRIRPCATGRDRARSGQPGSPADNSSIPRRASVLSQGRRPRRSVSSLVLAVACLEQPLDNHAVTPEANRVRRLYAGGRASGEPGRSPTRPTDLCGIERAQRAVLFRHCAVRQSAPGAWIPGRPTSCRSATACATSLPLSSCCRRSRAACSASQRCCLTSRSYGWRWSLASPCRATSPTSLRVSSPSPPRGTGGQRSVSIPASAAAIRPNPRSPRRTQRSGRGYRDCR